jgi:hypothetical protein
MPAGQPAFEPDSSPDWGTKNPSADLIILNSASQTSVNFAAILPTLRRLSKTLFLFFRRCCELATSVNLPISRQLSKSFLNYFSPPSASVSQRTRGGQYLKPKFAQGFFVFFFYFFSQPQIAANWLPGRAPAIPGLERATRPGPGGSIRRRHSDFCGTLIRP